MRQDQITDDDMADKARKLLEYATIPDSRYDMDTLFPQVLAEFPKWRELQDADTGETLLHVAMRNGSASICHILLPKNPHINALDDEDNTPLHTAVKRGVPHGTTITAFARDADIELCKELIKAGAWVNTVNDDENTPFKDAITNRNPGDLPAMLLRAGADPHLRPLNTEHPPYKESFNNAIDTVTTGVKDAFDGQQCPSEEACFKGGRLTENVLGSLGTRLFVSRIVKPLLSDNTAQSADRLSHIMSTLEPYWQAKFSHQYSVAARRAATFDPLSPDSGRAR